LALEQFIVSAATPEAVIGLLIESPRLQRLTACGERRRHHHHHHCTTVGNQRHIHYDGKCAPTGLHAQPQLNAPSQA